MRERLLNLLKALGINQKEFCNQTKISTSRLNEVLRGKTNNLSVEAIQQICKAYPNLNMRWLILGEGEMFLPDVSQSQSKQITDPRIQRIYHLLKEHPELIDITDKFIKGNITLREIIQKISTLPEKKQKAILAYIDTIEKL